MGTRPINANPVLKKILIVESLLWLLGAIIVTNISPAWMQMGFVVLTFLVLVTAAFYTIARPRRF